MSNPHESNRSGITDRECPNTKTLKTDDILSDFSAFGDVKYSKSVESHLHRTAGQRLEITADDDDDRLETKFLDLNEDCIHGILSTECLSALDLCSVAETCRRLKEITCRAFRRRQAKCNLNSLARDQAKSAQRILRNFGAVISDLEIRGWQFRDNGKSVLDSVANHCGNTLESLYLRGCVIPDNFPAKLKSIFKNLQKLRIDDCHFEGASKELFADCDLLVELDIDGEDVGFIVENTFPKLQIFKCTCGDDEYVYVSADKIDFDSFILRHKNLTSIAILSYLVMPSLLPLFIGDNCKRLEELELDIPYSTFDIHTLNLSNFGHLRKLKIYCYAKNVMTAVKGWNKLQFLEDLTLQQVIVDPELIQTLSQLRRLQVLRLWHCDGLENSLRIGDLNQLTELEIQSDGSVNLDFVALLNRLRNLKALGVQADEFKMNLETYLRIVDVVRARPDKSKLTLKLKSFYRRQQYDADMLHCFSLNADIVEMII